MSETFPFQSIANPAKAGNEPPINPSEIIPIDLPKKTKRSPGSKKIQPSSRQTEPRHESRPHSPEQSLSRQTVIDRINSYPHSYPRSRDSRSSIFSRKHSSVSAQPPGPPPELKPKTINIANIYEKEDQKRDLLYKFNLIKDKNPNIKIPDYSLKSDLNVMKQSYDHILKLLSVNNVVETYSQYLYYAFLAIELIIGKFTKIDMKGYAAHQQSLMSSYEKLLVELGEKTNPDAKSKIPVELRLFILVVINTAFFIGAKLALKDGASNFLNTFKHSEGQKTRAPITVPQMKPPSDFN